MAIADYPWVLAFVPILQHTQHTETYEVILGAVKGSAGAKKLAADFICKFVHHFPDLAEASD